MNIARLEDKIKQNPKIKMMINQSKNLDDFLRDVEKTEMINDFSLVAFFYRNPDIVIEDLKEIGILFNEIPKKLAKNTNKEFEISKESPSYQLIYPILTEPKEFEIWMIFFLKLGSYVWSRSHINVCISYVDEIVPAIFVTFGIIKSILDELKADSKTETSEDIKIQQGDEVLYLDGNSWRRAVVRDIKRNENVLEERFNPYIHLDVERAKGNSTLEYVPRTLWYKKIRTSANYKKTRGSIVRMNDSLSDGLIKRYGKEFGDKLKFFNEKYINLIGTGVRSEIEEVMSIFNFSDSQGNFSFNDYIYLIEDERNYCNVNIIKSYNAEFISNEKAISIFLGSSSGLNYQSFRTNRNIFFVNRKRTNLLNNQIFEVQISQEMLNTPDDGRARDFLRFLEDENVQIPKGCELIAY